MKNLLIIYIAFIIIITAFVSCNDYLDVNIDPNNPTADVVGPELILPAAQNASFTTLIFQQNKLGNIMANQWAADATGVVGANDDEYRFNVTSTFYNDVWESAYITSDKLQAIINKNSEKNAYYTAIAKVLKVHTMQYIVDLYGDCPYSEAFQRGENYQPIYDSALSVYQSMYAELEEAILLINTATNEVENPGVTDVMLSGDMDLWKKFANTLKLKLLVRASSSSDADAQAFVNSKWTGLATAQLLGNGENITINPGYTASSGKQNPFWNFWGYDEIGNQRRANKSTVGSQYFIEYLKAQGNVSPMASYDARIEAYFTPAADSGGDFQGFIQGAYTPENPDIGLSHIGPGLLIGADQDGLFFTASQSLFLQAEAVMKGKLTGNAQELFESAIKNSFRDYGKEPSAYLAGIADKPGIGWTGSFNDDMEAIIRQKWVALHGIDGAENYIEYNRTGFPELPLPLTAQKPHRPYRLLYPASELTGNSSNVPIVTDNDIFNPSIFWQY